MGIRLMDCTLRDGGNVVGKGFNAELTKLMVEGLIKSNIKTIEMGTASDSGLIPSAAALLHVQMKNI